MIKPTIGRVVLVYRPGNLQWEPALICYVHDDHRINVAGYSAHGEHFTVLNITLVHEPVATDPVLAPTDLYNADHPFAWWMPDQSAQAEKA
jgi:hypothetical protein